eukprot:349678-Chlamydomonas_euryale.AAC.7
MAGQPAGWRTACGRTCNTCPAGTCTHQSLTARAESCSTGHCCVPAGIFGGHELGRQLGGGEGRACCIDSCMHAFMHACVSGQRGLRTAFATRRHNSRSPRRLGHQKISASV